VTDLPETIGRYRIEGLIGRGGMGVVYRARDPNIDRTVALKVIRLPEDSDDEAMADLRERFGREARAAGKLVHPNIATVFDAGEDGGVPFITMEYVEGEGLDVRLKRSGGSMAGEAARVCSQVARALAYAHEQGVVHRDIKPANIIIRPDGSAKIMDFGIARLPGSEITAKGTAMGSPGYMSPEQITGKEVDGRSDLFSLGVVLYQMLTGEKPFTGDNDAAIAYAIVHRWPAPPSKVNPAIDPDFDLVMKKALAKDPGDRYRDAIEMARDLECIKAGEPIQYALESEDCSTRPVAAAAIRPGALRESDTEASSERYDNKRSDDSFLLAVTGLLKPLIERFGARRAGALLAAVAAVLVFGLWWSGRHERKIERLSAVVAANPSDHEAWRDLAGEYAALDRYGQAAGAYSKALELEPEYANEDVLDDLLKAPEAPDSQAVIAIARHFEDYGDRLYEAFESGNHDERWNAARSLREMGREVDWIAVLAADLESDDCETRKYAAQWLGRMGDPAAIPVLEEAMQERRNNKPCMEDSLQRAVREIKGQQEKSGRKAPLKSLKRDLKKIFR